MASLPKVIVLTVPEGADDDLGVHIRVGSAIKNHANIRCSNVDTIAAWHKMADSARLLDLEAM